ncbi:hypothetical protein WK13_34525 [Burkholderia ubonensis]|uniref:methyltransferase domain-containing protein n=1 Tax=Burkholderia ubonensis TaxID=101571 RepID=UPI0007550EE1|nr:methyltransferase domain-containing protein [Burkholderia ubonensis]KVR21655.1 hypothetical protein WK13_34525 [Burkholderia ubonensis]
MKISDMGAMRPIVGGGLVTTAPTGYGQPGNFVARDVTADVKAEIEARLGTPAEEVKKAATRSAVASKLNYNIPTKPAKRSKDDPRAERSPSKVIHRVKPASEGEQEFKEALEAAKPELSAKQAETVVTGVDIDNVHVKAEDAGELPPPRYETVTIQIPVGLHPETAKLVQGASTALANKLRRSELKYGYTNNWARPDWMDECRADMRAHMDKGDPLDVMAFAAFLWHHDEPTILPHERQSYPWVAKRYHYQRVFNAIADAVEVKNGPLSISVSRFEESMARWPAETTPEALMASCPVPDTPKADEAAEPALTAAHDLAASIPGDAYAAYGGDNIQNAMHDALKTQDTRSMDIPVDWTFHNKSIADNFDKHVREQLPWYDMATGLVAHFGRHYLPHGGRMYDMGASTGNITLALRKEIEMRRVKAISLDNSKEMANVWRGVGEFEVADVRDFEYQPYDFGVCFLLLMFLPPMEQRDCLNRMVAKLNPGGALVIFDKTDTFDGYLGTVTHRLTLAGKVAAGVPADEIVKKELSLAGAQRPIRPDMLLFNQLGAREVFRFGEFAGWVITK